MAKPTYVEIIGYMDAEDVLLFESERKDSWEWTKWLVQAYIEGKGGECFTLSELASYYGIKEKHCLELLNSHPLVERVGDFQKRAQFRSLAEPLEPSAEGLAAIALEKTIFDVGHQANKDYWDGVESKTLELRQRNAMNMRNAERR